jgi:CRP/FNR family transcriptional regulator, cyclic AMP receptor protein
MLMVQKMVVSLPRASSVACAFCPVGAASHVAEGGQCPMVDRHRTAGSCLYLAGSSADTVYYVKHGAVSLTRDAGDTESAPYAVRRAGSFIGLEAILRPTYLDSARAVTDVTVCATTRTQMLTWLDQMGTARVVLDCVLQAIAGDNAGRARTDGNAPQRVARWLREASKQKKLPRTILAGLLGMKPETLSRALAALARHGAIHLTRTRIDVRDPALLEAVATGATHL